MSKTYSMSVVGAGWGGHLSMTGASESDRFDLRAVADLSKEAAAKAKEKYPNIQIFTDSEQMFKACPTDIVSIATWPPSHMPLTLAALALPLSGIIVEKPLSEQYADGKRLLDAIKAKNIPVAVPHNMLTAPHTLEILDRVWSGDIGDLKLLEIQCAGWDIINAGIHWLNFFVNLTKLEPIKYVHSAIDSHSRTWRDGMQVETTAVTYAETASGVRVVMQTGDYVNINAPGKDTLFRCIGTLGTIEFYGWESAYRLINSQHPNGTLFQVAQSTKSGHQLHFENLAAQIDSGTPNYDIAKSSLMALEMCEAAYLSGREGCIVNLPLTNFTSPPKPDWEPGQPYSGAGGGRDGRNLP
ncbi:MAG: Gfo/Idh/MocA family oxidoreductase [Chloroflexota bacterium]